MPDQNEHFRAVDGNRSPWFAALKRRAQLDPTPDGYKLVLAEQRQLVIPWIRLPYFTYWRRGEFYGHTLKLLEISVRVFLETGHMPARWHV